MKGNLSERCDEAAAAIRAVVADFPVIGVVLGSGLGALAERLENQVTIPYGLIPHFAVTSVEGHRGQLVVGAIGGARVAVLQGRFHYYEGHDLGRVTFPVRVFQALGVHTLILTAATGGLSEGLRPGDLVAVSDHLNMLGANPLRGPNEERLGTRFPDMTNVYSPTLRDLAAAEAQRLGIDLKSGVYACMPGPSYETPAEIRMLRILGADVVGMSTVPEAIVARHAGIEVLALALVTNWAAGIALTPISHEEVIVAGQEAGPRLAQLIEAVVQRVAEEG